MPPVLPRTHNHTRFFRPFVSIPFGDRCVEAYSLIRRDLESHVTPIGANDLLIAATARAHDLIVVTHDVREFGRVPGLEIEDWEEPTLPANATPENP